MSALETKAAEEGAQVDVDSVAVENIVAVQDVLGDSPSASALLKTEDGLLTIKPEVLQMYLSLLAAPPQPGFHLPPSCWTLAGESRELDPPVGAAAALAMVAAMRKTVGNCMIAGGWAG